MNDRYKGAELHEGGSLAGLVPTALKMMGLEQPEAMTGKSLFS